MNFSLLSYVYLAFILFEIFYEAMPSTINPVQVWPLSKDFFGYDVVTGQPTGALHDCSFGAPLSSTGLPSFLFDSTSYVEVNITDSLSGDFSLLLYLFVDKAAIAGPLYQYVDQTDSKFFEAYLVGRYILMFAYDGHGDLTSSIPSSFRVALSWNLITIGCRESEGKVYMFLDNDEETFADIDFPDDLPVPGSFRIGHSQHAGRNLVGNIFCLQLFDIGLCRDAIHDYMDQSLCSLSPAPIILDKESTCIHHPKQANRAYFNLIASDMGPGNSTRSLPLGTYQVAYKAECGAICLSNPAC